MIWGLLCLDEHYVHDGNDDDDDDDNDDDNDEYFLLGWRQCRSWCAF